VLQDHADRKLEALLDNNEYEESQLIEIKMALNMPYQQRFTEYERHYGQIEIDGKSYTYVKKKIEGDIVIFKCIANESREQLKSAQNNIVKANSASDMDHSGPSKQQPLSFAKSMLSDYDDQHHYYQLTSFHSLSVHAGTHYNACLPKGTANTPYQPPEC
jgi:hypothetical protein